MLPPKSISDHNMLKKPLLYHWDLSWLRRFGGPMLRVVHLCACQRVPWHSEMIGEEVKGESRKCHGFEMFEPQHRSVFYNNIYIYTYTFNHVYNSLSYVHYIIDCQKILEVTSSLCPDQENLIRYFFLFQILMACENSDSAPQTMQIDPLKLLAWEIDSEIFFS